ncbi:TonB-linked outer membrane protein, SusC/RagA family [Mariniphaga anaerophila]|uniref:TonB-linked outer membrane protein, SusC/RagA family n=1 Tax=Mariniphaga anaerophila TaxID=1484053 RepID=A0A1M5EH64_9BACT|nr:TonB-dependent receptor [Mariniphaga anaerophila]SHF78402.1 TonB-linked outer membrane protein, SusC/RagA family [Mariniphaga anaerophila]
MNKNTYLFKLLFTCFFALSTSILFAQNFVVKGLVKSESGETLPGVNIVVKGTATGAITDLDGNYVIKLDDSNATLIFSFIGFKAQEIPVNGKNLINVTLSQEVEGLDEVVVVGYGSVKKSDLTGAVSSVKMDNIPMKPSNSIDGLLQGQSAGVQVTTSSDNPGASSTIRIRGGSSLRGGNDPLVVVDGFPIGYAGDLKQISPSDIASMEILKDASASAIYGSRGANGVIMITTKKGSKNTTEITVSQQSTVSEFTSELNLWRDPVLMARLSNENRINGGFVPLYIGAENANGVYYPSVNELSSGSWPYYTEWDDVVFRNPVSNNTNIAVRSQNEKTQFSLSGTYFTDEGVYIEDDYEKLNANLNVIHKVYDKLTVGTNVIFSKGNRNNNGGLAYWRNPVFPVYIDNDPTKGYYMAGVQDYSHPIALTENKTNTSDFLDFIGSAFAEAQVLPSLKLKSQVNYKFGRSINDYYNPKIYTQDGTFNNGSGGIKNWESKETVSETFLTYDKLFAEKHQFTAMGGFSYQYYTSRSSDLKAYDFLNESLGNENLAAGDPEKQSVSNSLTEIVMYSWLGRLNYTYNDKYLATFTMRADGSSKFGPNNQWAMFPSGALGWKMHHEDFIKNLNVFDELKLRGSFGISGNQGISPYLINSRYGQDQYYVDGRWQTAIGPGYVVDWESHTGKKIWGGIPNPDLRWETTRQLNIGTDMAFFNRRLRVIFDYYNKYTTDLLRERLLSPSSSYDRMWVNDGEIKNRGIELTFDSDIVNTKDWGVTAALILSKNKNEVVSLGDKLASGLNTDAITGMQYEFSGSQIEAFRAIPNILAVGQPVNVFYGYTVDGIIQSEEEGLAAGLDGKLAQAGEFRYVDLNEDGTIDEDDRAVIGDPNPDLIASLNMNVRYKNFDLAMFFNGSFGQDILNTKAFDQPSNMPLRWTLDNQTNDYPSLRDGRNYYMSDWFIQNGSYLRLQNVSLGYNINELNLSWFKRGRVYLNATNLFTITDFEGYDPEIGTDGIYWGGYPKLRKWTLGVELTF